MEPAVADQLTAVLAVPVTVAENCAVAESATVVFGGLTVTVMGAGGGGGAAPTVMFTGWLVDAPLSGFVTVTGNLPAAGRFPVAFKAVELTYIGTHGMPFT